MDHPPACQPPSRLATLLEVRAALSGLGLLAGLPKLLRAPKGDQRPVLLVPGYLADGYSMRPLGSYLRYLNYRVFDWGLGRNRGDVEEDIERLGAQVTQLSDQENGTPFTLIGWSLGGVLAREVARLYPAVTREVITIGTPIVGGPKYTAVAKRFEVAKKLNIAELEKDIHRRNCLGFEQPVTSIYSKSDGVVGWRSSIDVYNPQARNVEVKSSHIGLGLNPRVWLEIANTLSPGS